MSTKEEVYSMIGQVKCTDIVDMEDGTLKVTFDYDEKFKKEYKKLFGLRRFSKKHFEKQIQLAIINFTEQVQKDKLRLNLSEE